MDKKILLPLIAVMLSVLVVKALNYRNLASLDEAQQAAVSTQAIVQALGELYSNIRDLQVGQRGYIISGETSHLAAYYAALGQVEQIYESLDGRMSDLPQERSRLPELRASIDTKLELLAEGVDARAQQGFAAAQALIASDRGRAATDAIEVVITRMESSAYQQLTTRLGEVDRVSRLSRAFALYSLLAMVVVFALLAILVARITRARSEAAREVEEQREFLRTTIRSIGDAVIATDINGRVTMMNRQAEHLTGWTGSEAEGRPISEVMVIIHEGTRAMLDNPVERCLADNRVVGLSNHTLLIARGGREIPIDDSAAPIRGVKSEPRGAVIVFRDVTKRREMEDELRAQAAQLSEADRQKDQFLAVLAHELRNPLAPITNAATIAQQARDASTLRTAVEIIQRQTAQLNRLVDDLLDVSRINTGRFELRMDTVDLSRVIDQAVEMIRPRIEKLGQHIAVSMPAGPLHVHGDDARLAQILGNLLDNASKYSGPGTDIRLSVERQGDVLQISVRDQGIGISAEQIPRVFQMFTQIDDSQHSEGLGIGLALVQRLVELHGGSIEVTSAGLGRGSEFVVRLPATRRTPAERAPSPDTPVPPRRVLVVDDNVDAASTLVYLLESAGHTAQSAHSGREALELAAAFRPDLVFLDLGMPGMSGFEVCRAIRAESWGATTAIYALTGWGQADDRARTQGAGFDGHLVKPVSYRSIAETLRDPAIRLPAG